MVLSGPLLSVTNRTPGSWCVFLDHSYPWSSWLFLPHSYSYHIVLPHLRGSFLPTLICKNSHSRVLVCPFWPNLIRNESYSRVLVAPSGPLLSVYNLTPCSWWLFRPSLIRNKSYCRVYIRNSILCSIWRDTLWEVVGCGVLCGFRALGFKVKGVAICSVSIGEPMPINPKPSTTGRYQPMDPNLEHTGF